MDSIHLGYTALMIDGNIDCNDTVLEHKKYNMENVQLFEINSFAPELLRPPKGDTHQPDGRLVMGAKPHLGG